MDLLLFIEKTKLKAEREELRKRALSLQQKTVELQNARKKLPALIGSIDLLQAHLHAVRRALGARRAVLVREVSEWFPITSDTTTRALCIAGHRFELRAKASSDEEILAGTLGVIVLVLSHLFPYLGIVPRFPSTCFASRSIIRDPVFGEKYPLYLAGADSAKFKVGLRLINKSIEQVGGAGG